MLVFVILAVFIAGLMVGRTPEYLGKKIQAYDVKLAMLVLIVLSARSSASPRGPRESLGPPASNNAGPHGFSRDPLRVQLRDRQQRQRVRRSHRQHDGWRYNNTLALAMLAGRFLMIVPIMALAGSPPKKTSPPSRARSRSQAPRSSSSSSAPCCSSAR
jgi:K+-transporting ATPase ATPase A chain